MNIVPFMFESNPVRVLDIGGDPWFVGKDVAEALGYSNPQKALRDHCKKAQNVGGERFVHPSDLDPQTKIVPEGDVYRLIIKSNMPKAEAFEEMVMEEILPTIRKTGSYAAQSQVPQTYEEALEAQLVAVRANKALQIENDAKDALIGSIQPKADALDRLDTAEGNLTVRPASKVLGYPERKLTHWLQANRWAFRSSGRGPLQAYVEKRNTGYLDHKLGRYENKETGDWETSITLTITPKGMARLAKLLPAY